MSDPVSEPRNEDSRAGRRQPPDEPEPRGAPLTLNSSPQGGEGRDGDLGASPTSARYSEFIGGHVPCLAIAAVVVVSMIVLRSQDRVWWCACRSFSPWWEDVWSAHGCQHLIDPYSFTHVLHGVVLFWLLAVVGSRVPVAWRLFAAVLLEAFWEVFENSSYVLSHHRAATANLGYVGDSIANSLGDIAACALGFVLARRLGWRRSLVLFVVTELVLLVWIRDSLLLIVVTSLFPSDVVKAWQMSY